MEIQVAREEPENEANFSQVDSSQLTLTLSESDTIMNGSMRQTADHRHVTTTCCTVKAKPINMHVTFHPSAYCRVLLTEVRSDCKSIEHIPSDTQTGRKTSMTLSGAIFWRGNSPWSRP